MSPCFLGSPFRHAGHPCGGDRTVILVPQVLGNRAGVVYEDVPSPAISRDARLCKCCGSFYG